MDLSFLANINIFDGVLALLVFGFLVYGFMKGFIRMLGDFIGFLIGIWVAGQYFAQFYEWTQSLYLGNENIGKLISFLLILVIVRKIISWIVMLIDKFFNLLAIIPFLSLINRLGGAIFGLLNASVLFGILIYFLSRYSIGFWFDKLMVNSQIAKLLAQVGEFISPLLPEILRGLHSLI